ncbi:MAG: flagellar biosynthesis protein FlhF [Campylobacterota bacterium]|nr:flagellar biosynthesis protein FlhF [Campylobacterota bacterium]
MKMLSFLGETPTKALQNAQKECGSDAVVISTKKISSKTKHSENMYEIVVALEEEYDKHKDFPTQNIVHRENTENTKSDSDEIINNTQFYDFKSQIENMQDSISAVQKSLWEPKSHLYDLIIPPEFIDIYSLFERNEFDSEMMYSIMKKTIEQLPVAMKSNPVKVKDFFKLILRRIIAIKHEVPLRMHQRKILMFVGPTGVGKTTTIAKLAARYAYKMGTNYKVGIVTLDSFRVGAIEQLKAYTNIMRLPLEIVKKPEELNEAIGRLKECHYILIDTAGGSQYDVDKIELINQYQLHLNEIPIEKMLVLPSNVKATDLHEIYNNYSTLHIHNLIFTKLDETISYGNLISFAHKTKKSICYLSVGQNVPDDLIEANSNYLIDCFMNRHIPKR